MELPQIDGLGLTPVPCQLCERILPTEIARNQHESVAHAKEKGEVRMGEALADALVRGLRTPVGQPASVSMSTAVSGLPYVCGFCQDGFTSPVALGKHVKQEHKA